MKTRDLTGVKMSEPTVPPCGIKGNYSFQFNTSLCAVMHLTVWCHMMSCFD